MPHYDYKCGKCAKVWEIFQNITEAPKTRCPDKKCDGRIHRLIEGGSGF